MRIAALYDIHGNLPALDAVLQEVKNAGVDRVFVGGDVVPGPMPAETIDRLLNLDLPVEFIHGNGELAVLDEIAGKAPAGVPEKYRPALQWTARQIQSRYKDLLSSWPPTVRVNTNDWGEILFCHATPRNATEIFTRLTLEERLLSSAFMDLDVSSVICGHTHMQFNREIGNLRVVNAGSVGMPFGEPGAYWLLLGATIELRHTQYDLEAAAEMVRRTEYPEASEFADHNVLRPPTEQQMLDAFSRVELK
jgi:predicted phosphodiesterase